MFRGNKKRLELAYSLLFSLPGAPTLIYGDEIGIGDDLSQKGRNAVRTPMQWAAGKNGGFSSAPADRLIQPMVRAGAFSYRKTNVEAQDKDPSSLLNTIRRFSKLRRDHPAIGRSPLQPIPNANPAVFCHRIQQDGGGLLILHNLSREAQSFEIDTGFMGNGVIRDLVSGTEHAFSGTRTRLKLPPYGFLWGQTELEM
jgi:maltose alpha-D-glucosyltransferase/alpha-amylase